MPTSGSTTDHTGSDSEETTATEITHTAIEIKAKGNFPIASNTRWSLWKSAQGKALVNFVGFGLLAPTEASAALWATKSAEANIIAILANAGLALSVNYYFWRTNRNSALQLAQAKTDFDAEFAELPVIVTDEYEKPEEITTFAARQKTLSQLLQHGLPAVIYLLASLSRIMGGNNTVTTTLYWVGTLTLILPQLLIAKESRAAITQIEAQQTTLTQLMTQSLREENQALKAAALESQAARTGTTVIAEQGSTVVVIPPGSGAGVS